MTQSGIFEQDGFLLVKRLTWVLGDLSSKPDVPQHVGERVSKSLNYSVPYFCLQTVSNIHPVLCLCKAPQSLAKNLLIASHIKGLKQIEAAAVHQLWMQRGQVLRPNSRTNVNKPQIYFTSSESMLGLQKCSATSLLFPTHCSNYLQNLLVVMPPLAPSQGLDYPQKLGHRWMTKKASWVRAAQLIKNILL